MTKTKQMYEELDKYMKDRMDEAVDTLMGELVDDVDKKVDKEGAVVLRDSRLSEDIFMIYWRKKQKKCVQCYCECINLSAFKTQ